MAEGQTVTTGAGDDRPKVGALRWFRLRFGPSWIADVSYMRAKVLEVLPGGKVRIGICPRRTTHSGMVWEVERTVNADELAGDAEIVQQQRRYVLRRLYRTSSVVGASITA